jgi:antitoxin (DNA-binding transcriptional repressor) of toxin-antitoxin stability system
VESIINVKKLRASLPEVARRVKRGERFTVIYRSEPAFRIVPLADEQEPLTPLDEDPLYRATSLGRSRDGYS